MASPTPPSSLFHTGTTIATESSATENRNIVIDSICIGSGRFLRSVLVPALVAASYHPVVIQTRGRTFLDYCWKDAPTQNYASGENEGDGDGDDDGDGECESSSRTNCCWTYEVDTVHYDGRIETTNVPCWGAGTLGSPEGKNDVLELCSRGNVNTSTNNGDDGDGCGDTEEQQKPLIVGVGVTEAGLSSASTKAMKDLYDILAALSHREPKQRICVINTDNVSKNGTVLRTFMNELAANDDDEDLQQFLADSVVFHNTMVDRITSQRPGSNGLVPRAEPTPLKALVIEDLGNALPSCFLEERLRKEWGVVVRILPGQLDADIALKLRIANGTHTAAAHAMALTGLVTTDVLSAPSDDTASLLMRYLDSFFEHQIAKGIETTTDFEASPSDARAVYEDWRRRLVHAHFGLSTFFITQNGAAKAGIRIGPTIKDLILSSKQADASNNNNNDTGTSTSTSTSNISTDAAATPTTTSITCSTVFALAAILKFLTSTTASRSTANGTVYGGLLDPKRKPKEETTEHDPKDKESSREKTVAYADGLSYDLEGGRYEFRCACQVAVVAAGAPIPLPEALSSIGLGRPVEYEALVRAYLCKSDGGDLSGVAHTPAFGILVKAVAALYARMVVGGDGMLDILNELDLEAGCECLIESMVSE